MARGTQSPAEKVEPEQIWFHQGNPEEPYKILEVLQNATGYEMTGEVGDPIVLYEQQYDGEVAKKGTRWTRELTDFLGMTEIDGKEVRNFVRKSKN